MKIVIGLIVLFALTCNKQKDMTSDKNDKADNQIVVVDKEVKEVETEKVATKEQIKVVESDTKKPVRELSGKRAEIVGQWKLEKIVIVGRQRSESTPEVETKMLFQDNGQCMEIKENKVGKAEEYAIYDELLGNPALNIQVGESGSPGLLTIENDTMIIDHSYYDGARFIYTRVNPE